MSGAGVGTSYALSDGVTRAAISFLQEIDQLERLDDRAFRDFECDLVRHYRRQPDDQEAIAIALMQKRVVAVGDRLTFDRVDEILAMLDHVHDPLISGD